MAGLGRGKTRTLALVALLLGAVGLGFAQPTPDSSAPQLATASLSGRLTDLHSKALEGVAVVLRNQATGTEVRTVTAKNGVYRFTELAPGVYTLTAQSALLGRGQLEEIEIEAGHETRLQAAMEFTPASPEPDLAAAKPPSGSEAHVNSAGPSQEISSPPTTKPGSPVEAEHAAEKLHAEGGEGFTPRTEPAESTRASAPENPASPIPPKIPSPPQATPVVNPSQLAKSNPAPAAPPLAPPKPKPAPSPQPPLTDTLSAHELQSLPVSGRHWQDFVLGNAPAAVTPSGGQGPISLQGSGRQSEVTVDGMSRALAFGSTNNTGQSSGGRGGLGQSEEPAGMAQVGAGGHGLAVSEAAIRAVETVAGNVEAAERATSGAQMWRPRAAPTAARPGFLFDRQNTWGAQNPFTQWVTETSPAVLNYDPTGPPLSVPVFDNGLDGKPESYTPSDRETTFGAGLGSRIRRKRLFWFAALDGDSRDDPGLSTVKHPYVCASYTASGQCTVGGFFAQPSDDQLNVLCAQLELTLPGQPVCSNGLVQGLTAYSQMLETLAGLLGPAARTAIQGAGFTRLDWQASERFRLMAEGIGAYWNSPGGGLTRVEENYGNHSFGSSQANEEWLLARAEAFITPNLLSTSQFSLGHGLLQARPATPSAFEKTLLAGNIWGQLPQIVVDNRYGFTIGNPSRFGQGNYPDERLYHLQQSVDWVRGNLLVKAGFSFDHSFDQTSMLRNQTGTYTYSNVENFVSDALVFAQYGLGDALDPDNQHNCDETGKAWRDSGGRAARAGQPALLLLLLADHGPGQTGI